VTTEDLDGLIRELRAAGGDTASVEVKSAAGGLPTSISSTLSALANLPGGGSLADSAVLTVTRGFGDRATGDRRQGRPFGLGISAGVLIPSHRLGLAGAHAGQAGAGVEGLPATGGVLQAGEEPVGEGAGLEGLAARPAESSAA
jgi:hypothetical protein